MSYSELASNSKEISKKQIKFIQSGSVVDLVNETHEITKNIYKSVLQGEDLKYKYSYEHMGLVRTQLQKAGLRLASLLNNILC